MGALPGFVPGTYSRPGTQAGASDDAPTRDTQSVSIGLNAQSITFTAPGTAVSGSTFTITPSAS